MLFFIEYLNENDKNTEIFVLKNNNFLKKLKNT